MEWRGCCWVGVGTYQRSKIEDKKHRANRKKRLARKRRERRDTTGSPQTTPRNAEEKQDISPPRTPRAPRGANSDPQITQKDADTDATTDGHK